MKYYIVSDVHGYCTYLRKALSDAGFFDDPEEHKLVVCGDLLDRGQEANQIIDFMIEQMEKDQLIYILGNHEDLFVRCLQEIASGGVYEIANGMSHHFTNGTWDTLLQISGMQDTEAYVNPNELIRRVRNSPFYKRLLPFGRDYFETEKYVFCHGYIPCFTSGYRPCLTYTYDPDWREASVDYWQKARWYNGAEVAMRHHVRVPDKTVVCGHFHASYAHCHFAQNGDEWGKNADYTPYFAPDGSVISIDSCAAYSGFLNCLTVSDTEIGGDKCLVP